MENQETGKREQKLSDNDLKEKMHFDKFMGNYKPVPLYRSFRLYGTLAAASLLLWGVYYLSKDDVDIVKAEKTLHDEIFVSQPLPSINVSFSRFAIQGNADTVLNCSSGSILHIPRNAFLDSKRKPVSGGVDLLYREFRDVADFFASGIPMTFDSGGTKFYFESAGMIEILASKNGEALFANTDKQIDIDMVSDIPGFHFNVYFLDTLEKRWTYLKSDLQLNNQPSPGSDKDFNPAYFQLHPPQKADNKLPSFDISFDKKQFPELIIYDGVSFEVNENEKYYDRKLAMKEWDKVKLERLADGKHYQVTFTNPNEEHVFKVRPVYSGSDYTRAHEQYVQKMKSRETNLTEKKSSRTITGSNMDSSSRGHLETLEKSNPQGFDNNLVVRQFRIGRFGIWNSACLVSMPRGRRVYAKFIDGSLNELVLNALFLAERDRRVIYSIVPGRYSLVSFNPQEKNVLWGITKENKLVVCGHESFDKAESGPDSVIFVMKCIEPLPASMPQLRKILQTEY